MEDTLGKRISANRKRLGLTQEQLAEQLGISPQAVSKWENDQTCPDITILPRLAEIFGVSTDVLLGREEPAREGTVHQAEVVDPAEEEKGSKTKFEFHWDGGKKGAFSFAVFVLLVGGAYLAAKLLQLEMSFWDVLWPSAIIGIGFAGILYKFSFFNIACLLFGSFFLAKQFIPVPLPVDGGVIWAVLILLWGVSLLVDVMRKRKKGRFHIHYTDKNGNTHTGERREELDLEEDGFSYDASFGESTQKVTLERMQEGEINTSFGAYTVDLTGVQTVTPDCTLEANVSFGELTLIVPRRFMVRVDSSTSFAGFDIKGHPDSDPQGTICLEANVSFGEIQVVYE